MAGDIHKKFLLQELFFRAVEKFRERVAVTFSGRIVESISYCDLGKTVRNLSYVFKRTFMKNEIVGVYSRQHIHLPTVLLAINDAEAAFYPIAFSSSPQMVVKTLERHFIRYVLVESCLTKKVIQFVEVEETDTGLGRGTRRLLLIDKEDKELCDLLRKVQFSLFKVMDCEKQSLKWSDKLAYVMQTSGTTGKPKAVYVPHSCIVPNVIHLSTIFDVTFEDVVFLASPSTFDPFVVQMFLAFCNGAALLIVPETVKQLPALLCHKLFDEHHVTILQLTPSFCYYIGPGLISEKILCKHSSVTVLAFGGETCPSYLVLSKWKQPENQTKLFNLYGITEVSSWASCYRITDSDLNKTCSGSKSRSPLGFPLIQTQLIVYDSYGNPVNGDGIGHLWIGGKDRRCMLEGESVESIPDFRDSGDLVEMKDSQIWYLGRADNQLKRFGQRVNLEFIENVVLEAADVSACSLVLESVADNRKLIHLFVVPEKHMRKTVEQFKCDLKRHLRDTLPRAAQPDEIHVIFNLPLTDHGKINKRKLLNSLADSESEDYVGLAVADALSKMWLKCIQSSSNNWVDGCAQKEEESSEMIRRITNSFSEGSTVKPEDTFILHGGDSFGAVNLASAIQHWTRQRWEADADVSMLFHIVINKSFGDLVSYVEKMTLEIEPASLTGPKNSTEQLEFKPVVKRLRTNEESSTSLHGNKVREDKFDELKSKMQHGECMCFARRGGERVPCIACQGNSMCLLSSAVPFDFTAGSRDQISDQLSIIVKWQTCLDKCIDASPLVLPSCLIDRGAVFVGSHSHVFMSVSLSKGDLIWQTRLGDRVESSSCLSLCGRMVVVGCYDGKIYVLARSNGQLIWTYQTGDVVKSSPCLDSQTGLVWTGSHDGYLYALDVKQKLCAISVNCHAGACFSSPAICYEPHQVYIGTLRGCFCAVNAVSGEIAWFKKCTKPIFASPLVQKDKVFLATVDGSVQCFDHCGNNIWQYSAAGPVFSSPVPCLSDIVSATDIVIGCHDHNVYCLTGCGKCKWSVQMNGPVYSTAAIASYVTELSKTTKGILSKDTHPCLRFVFAITTKGTLYVLDARDGHVFKTFAFPGEIFSSPVVIGRQVVVGCRNNFLYCVELSF